MRPIERSEILPLGEYEAVRSAFRARVIQEKKARRVALGQHLSAVFENRDSVMLQIQEMLRTERITSERGILHEIETYNELVPRDGELSFTLFVEIPDRELRDRMLQELAGLENSVRVEIDGAPFSAEAPRRDDSMPDRTTAVHYFKVALSPEAASALREKRARVALVVDHPRYAARTELGPATLAALADDLA